MANNKRNTPRAGSRVAVNDQPVGNNLYLDKKGRLIYYSVVLKKAYYVPKFDYKKFNRFKARYITVVAAFMVLYTLLESWFHISWWIPVVISLALWAGLEYSFYKYVKTLQPVKKFDRQDLTPTNELEYSDEMKKKCMLKIALYILLGVLLVLNAYEQHYSSGLLICCWLAMVFCFWQAGVVIYTLMRSKKAWEAGSAKNTSKIVMKK